MNGKPRHIKNTGGNKIPAILPDTIDDEGELAQGSIFQSDWLYAEGGEFWAIIDCKIRTTAQIRKLQRWLEKYKYWLEVNGNG